MVIPSNCLLAKMEEYINNLKTLPQHGYTDKIINLLGEGRYGYAWRMEGNKVVKITTDWTEFNTALFLKGKETLYLVRIFDCWEAQNKQYVIIEELLYNDTPNIDAQMKTLFVDQFKLCWFEHNKRLGGRVFNYYSDVLMKYCKEQNISVIEDVHQIFKKWKYWNYYYDMMFKSTCAAIHELHTISPQAMLDINEDNIMFTNDEQMKFIDMH